jgi:integrase
MITSIEKGEYFEFCNLTLEKYLDKWMLEYCESNLVYKTYKTYTQLIEWYIKPQLGSIELSKLQPLHIQSFYTYLQKERKLSSTTTLHCHNIIHTALKHAVKWQLININIADAVERPKRAKTEFNTLSVENVDKLLEYLEGTSLYMPVLLSLHTGARRGEVLGLTWGNVNLVEGFIYIKNQLQNIDGTLQLTQLKTLSSKRKIVLLDYTIKVLKEERKKQLENKLYLGENYIDNNFVCCQNDGRPYDPDYISRHFLRKSTSIDIPKVRFHDLRHTHATLLLQANVNSKVVSERLGHSKVNITLDTYSHVLPDMQKEAVKKLQNIMQK